MGYSVTTIAIRGKSPELIHAEYGVRPTGEWQEEPEAAVAGVLLPRGWYLLYINDRLIPEASALAQLSLGAEIIHSAAEEHVMASNSAGWHNGKVIWSIAHDAEMGVDHLDTSGDLPEELAGIANRLKDRQKT